MVIPLATEGTLVLGEMRSRSSCSLAGGPLALATLLVLAGGRPGRVKTTTAWGTGSSQPTEPLAVEHAIVILRIGAQVRPCARLVVQQ